MDNEAHTEGALLPSIETKRNIVQCMGLSVGFSGQRCAEMRNTSSANIDRIV